MRRAGAFFVAAVPVLLLASWLSAQSSKTSAKKSAPPQDYSFTVIASRVWTDTGLDLEAGDRVHIYGAVLACENATPSEKAHLPLPSAPGGALLVKVHLDMTPINASPDAELPILDPSHLYLGVNGWSCHGAIPVKVHVDWHKRPEDKH